MEYINAIKNAFSVFVHILRSVRRFSLDDVEVVRMVGWPQYNAEDILLKVVRKYKPGLPRVYFLLTTHDITGASV